MLIPTINLPTHLALVTRRINAIGIEQSADTFLLASYLAESTIKTIGIALYQGLTATAPEIAYRFGYSFIRSDGLGEWDQCLRSMTATNVATFMNADFRPLIAWATMKRSGDKDLPFRNSYTALLQLLELCGGESDRIATPSMRDLITALVQLRNKTKGHGAWGPDFYQHANSAYLSAISTLLLDCPILNWEWIHITVVGSGKIRGIWAKGEGPVAMTEGDTRQFSSLKTGLYFRTDRLLRPYWCGDLVHTDQECRQFFLPNGGHNGKDKSEFLDYATPEHRIVDVTSFSRPPVALPSSETVGLESIEIQSNVFGNLPDPPKGYVERPQLQIELIDRLIDNNHPVITLHGRGGMGKTSLAIFTLHSLSINCNPRFEHIIWFSARDLDLRGTGPAQVRQSVVDLKTVCKQLGKLLDGHNTPEAFAALLQNPGIIDSQAILFVFDNFETMYDMDGLHKFLDTHTHLPNKILITSRERTFKGDFPIEVRGMERPEAMKMISDIGEKLSISSILTESIRDEIFDRTEGHPYVMRITLGEVAKSGNKHISIKTLVPYRGDVISAVFERSFNKLSPDGRYIFLCVSNWRSAVPEIALLVVLSLRDINVEAGIDECHRLSLINQDFSNDRIPYYSAPEIARAYGRKKLEGDPDKLAIEESLELIRSFGVIQVGVNEQGRLDKQIGNFCRWCVREANLNPMLVDKLDSHLLRLAEFSPIVWIDLAVFREDNNRPRADIEYSLRRAVEELPSNVDARKARAQYAESVGDDTTRISSLVSAVELQPGDISFVKSVAGILTDYLTKHKQNIPIARRGVYLANIRNAMLANVTALDATGLSRLAWLFLLENNETEARRYAAIGLKLEPTNQYCLKIFQNLKSS